MRSTKGSSLIPIFKTVATLAKGIEILVYENRLLATEKRNLRKANEALSRRRRAKKTRIRQGGALTVEDAHDIMAQGEMDAQIHRERRAENSDNYSTTLWYLWKYWS